MIKQHDINMASLWIAEYFAMTGKRNAIVGLSGGIDSAVTAYLCKQALGKDRVLGVILPIESSATDGLDAMQVVEALGIDYVTISEGPAFNRFYTDLVDSPKVSYFLANGALTINKTMVRANIKARFRMTSLYAISEMADGLVVGTTNKSEAKIGYATKYGDGGVDLEPLMDFYKTEIFEMAELLEIPQSIIDKKPSAGL